MNLRNNIMNILKRLVKISGISGTKSEDSVSAEIFNILNEIPYFNMNSNDLKLHKIENDPYGRHFVTAFLKGRGASSNTLILTGHYDVVGIEDFGSLKGYAFDMLECTRRAGEMTLSEDARKDLQSGDWIFGRGTADMKYGLALEIEVIREMSQKCNFTGNILFLAVPGEESNSEGMLAAVEYLAKLKTEGLNFKGLLLAECCIPKYPGDTEKRIYTGTCGKLMPAFFCVGKETHVCEPLSGLNPNLLVSEINRLMELNIDFCENDGQNTSPPPVCLKQTDLKGLYSVQTPLYSAAYYNLITLDMDIKKTLDKLKNVAEKACENVMKIVNERNKEFNRYIDVKSSEEANYSVVPIYTYDDIYMKVKEVCGSEFENTLKAKVKEWLSEGMDNQSIGINIMRETFEHYKNKEPMVIIGFIPPFYPDRELNDDAEFLKEIEYIIDFASEKYQINIKKEKHFMGICDLSYTGFSGRDMSMIEKNMCAGENYLLPMESLKILDIPSVVFGGFGKDFHKNTERLNLSYSLDIVPELFMKFISNVLK